VHKCVDLSSVQLDAPALQALATAAIAPHVGLCALNLRGSGLGAAGAATLAAVLNQLPFLRVLLLGENGIGDAGVAALALSVTDNTTVQALDLHKNSITAAGAASLAAALRRNASLVRCDLADNRLASAGVVVLAAALGANNTLADLRLEWRGVHADARGVWDEAVASRRAPLTTEWYCALRVERVRVMAGEARAACPALAWPRLVGMVFADRATRTLTAFNLTCNAQEGGHVHFRLSEHSSMQKVRRVHDLHWHWVRASCAG
jgi:hypothetical protein